MSTPNRAEILVSLQHLNETAKLIFRQFPQGFVAGPYLDDFISKLDEWVPQLKGYFSGSPDRKGDFFSDAELENFQRIMDTIRNGLMGDRQAWTQFSILDSTKLQSVGEYALGAKTEDDVLFDQVYLFCFYKLILSEMIKPFTETVAVEHSAAAVPL